MRLRAALLVSMLVGGGARADDAGEYSRIEHDFGIVPRAETLAALDRFAREHAGTSLGARALVWRGQLALIDKDVAGAERRFRAALARGAPEDQARFAHRGLGDVSVLQGRYDQAEREYGAALDGADVVLRSELEGKREMVGKLRFHRRAGFAALAGVLLVALLFGARAARGVGPLRVPLEAIFTLPIFAVILGGARRADRRMLAPLAICAVGALVLITASGLASERAPSRSRAALALHVALLVAAFAALFYASAALGNILDLLRDTFAPQPA
jgi:hypothetical protein